MKKILFFAFILINVVILKAQYDFEGYDKNNKVWNIGVKSYNYIYKTDQPELILGFGFTIENNTTYIITGINIEFTLSQNGENFYKKTMHVKIRPGAAPGEIVQTDEWRMNTPLLKTQFDTNTTWNAKVTKIYIPESDESSDKYTITCSGLYDIEFNALESKIKELNIKHFEYETKILVYKNSYWNFEIGIFSTYEEAFDIKTQLPKGIKYDIKKLFKY